MNVVTRDIAKAIIIKYWDYFVKKGAKRTIIGYGFGIEKAVAKPVCYRKPSYNLYESKVFMTQVAQLLGKG